MFPNSKIPTHSCEEANPKKKALLQEAAEKVTDVVAEADKVTEAMKPIMEKDADSLSPEEAVGQKLSNGKRK